MQLTYWCENNTQQQQALLQRPAISVSGNITQRVKDIINRVKKEGDKALYDLSLQFDNTPLDTIQLPTSFMACAEKRLNNTLKQAVKHAFNNIYKFHHAQQFIPISLETQPGVICQQVVRPIDSVGLYIPGGSAPLLSTVLMLAIPAQLAGCKQIILCSPPPISNEILYVSKLCGITHIYQIGGAQAIAAMAFGTESVPKVNKIFGPGNAYVTEAKRQVTQHIGGVAIDMPAGPSEVLIIADSSANPVFTAADLLSQAEHGVDSQVILLTPDESLAQAVAIEIKKQLATLPRESIAEQALANSRLIVTRSLEQAIEISNRYAPEHLIIQTENADTLVDQINHAGSIFLGNWSPESVGDYASGTNHVLPTYGYCTTYSSLGLADFQKRMTIQKITPKGLLGLGETVETLAQAEQLIAHKRAVTLRLAALKQK